MAEGDSPGHALSTHFFSHLARRGQTKSKKVALCRHIGPQLVQPETPNHADPESEYDGDALDARLLSAWSGSPFRLNTYLF